MLLLPAKCRSKDWLAEEEAAVLAVPTGPEAEPAYTRWDDLDGRLKKTSLLPTRNLLPSLEF